MNRAELHWLVAGLIPCDATTASIVARRVVDAILPQITTVEQLADVTPDSWLVDRDGDGYQKVSRMTVTDGDGTPWTIEEVLKFGPLTVVWAV